MSQIVVVSVKRQSYEQPISSAGGRGRHLKVLLPKLKL